MTVSVSTVYALDMPKYVYVQLHATQGGPAPALLKIRADKFVKNDNTNQMVLMLGAETVGEIHTNSVAGWWIQDESGRDL
jgi:hypothetical protein